MEEALEIIDSLLDGERVDHDGPFFRTKGAYLHTPGSERPPVYVSAFGPARRWRGGALRRRPLDARRSRVGAPD